jgi:HK97 family phage portal protein
MGGGQPAAGMPVTQDTAMTSAAVFACTQARAETLASLPPMVYQEMATNSRRRHSENQLWQLLHDCPNPIMDSMTFWELIEMRIVNRGNGFAEIVRNRRDEPVELWPIHNSRVEPTVSRSGALEWRVYCDPSPTSPLYDGRHDDHRYYLIPDRDMLNIPGFASNGIIGRGVIPAASEEISAGLGMTQFSGSFFRNGAKPAAVVTHPGYVDDDQKRRIMREDLNRSHSGRENWNQIAILWEGMTYKEIQVSPEQAQLLETKKHNGKTICQFYKVPPAMVQIFDDYKFSSVDAMIQQFVMTCLRADAVRIERAVRRKLTHTMDSRGQLRAVFDSPYVFEFVLEALLRGDAKKQAETLEIERKWGIINADEWRALSNREPIPGIGGIYTIAGGTEDLAKLGQTYPGGKSAARAAEAAGSSGRNDDAEEQTESSGPKFDRGRLVQALERGIPAHRDRSPGGRSDEATTVRDELDKAAAIVLSDAVVRVESILEKELAKCNGDETKIESAWQKHSGRLASSIRPAVDVYSRYRDVDASSLAVAVAQSVARQRLTLGADVTVEVFEGISNADAV